MNSKNPLIAFRVTKEQYSIIIEKFGSQVNIRDFILRTLAGDHPELLPQNNSEILIEIQETLNEVFTRVSELTPRKKSKPAKNNDFEMTGEEFKEKAIQHFLKVCNNKQLAAEQYNLFINYWCEKTATNEPLWRTQTSWELTKRIDRWMNTYNNQQGKQRTKIDPKPVNNNIPRTSKTPTHISKIINQ